LDFIGAVKTRVQLLHLALKLVDVLNEIMREGRRSAVVRNVNHALLQIEIYISGRDRRVVDSQKRFVFQTEDVLVRSILSV
jgi:hypothetical protein